MTWMQLVARRDRAACTVSASSNCKSINKAWPGGAFCRSGRSSLLTGSLLTTGTRCAPQCTLDPAAEDVQCFFGGSLAGLQWLAAWLCACKFRGISTCTLPDNASYITMGPWRRHQTIATLLVGIDGGDDCRCMPICLHGTTPYPSPHMDSIMQG